MRYRFGWLAVALCTACAGTGILPRAVRFAGPPVTGLQYVRQLGGRGTGRGQFTAPGAVCTDLAGNLYVADTGNDRIQKFSPDGEYTAQAGGFGFGTGQFNKPGGLAVNNGLELWVADTRNARLQQYDTDLHFAASFKPLGKDGDDVLSLPLAVTASPGGDLLVSDGDNGLFIFNPFGSRTVAFGGFGYGAGHVDAPVALAAGADGEVYICDPDGGRIAVFDRFGSYQYDLGRGELNAPRGVATDNTGAVYVADTGNNRVVVFGADGAVRAVLGAMGSGPGAFRAPTGIATTPDGKMVYVADTGNHRIQVLRVRRERQ